MRVTAIVPMYNAGAHIAAALDSILAQTRPVDEIIVVDDGSTDDGPDIVAGYEGRVRLLRQKQSGPSRAINRGLRAATGDTIAFLDADDLWMPEKQALQCRALAEDAAIDCVFGHIVQFLSDDAASAAGRYFIPAEPVPGICRQCLLVRREAFDRFGWFDEALTTADFVPWYARAVAMGLRYRMLDEVLARRRLHLGNTGVTRRREQQQESLLGLRQALSLRRAKDRPGA
jgi:glycosyltransferase involved in cell wall biosynthesis